MNQWFNGIIYVWNCNWKEEWIVCIDQRVAVGVAIEATLHNKGMEIRFFLSANWKPQFVFQLGMHLK